MAAAETDDAIVDMSFTTTKEIVEKQMPVRFNQLLDSFQECIKCLSEFACNANYPDICMESIKLIRVCARYVAERSQAFR